MERNLSLKKAQSNEHQMYVWSGGDTDLFLWPRYDLPVEPSEPFAGSLIATWYASNGAQGKKPEDPNLLKALELLRSGAGVELEERNKLGQEIKRLIVDNQWTIGTVGFNPILRVFSNKLRNVPDRYVYRARNRQLGANQPATYYFKT
jgi:peptide/nickel transport system substrate-binding protein